MSDEVEIINYGEIIDVQLRLDRLTDSQKDRLKFAYSYYRDNLSNMANWTVASHESSNFTYEITDLSKHAFAGGVAAATGARLLDVAGFIDEAFADRELIDAVVQRASSENFYDLHDPTCLFGRRVGWYAAVRVLKPRVVIETGVDKGLGSILLASALRKNTIEGSPGHHYGTDIDPSAGYLVHGPWKDFSTILYGDSIETLSHFDKKIDIFINDSDHSHEYELREYQTIDHKLSSAALVLGDNSHSSEALYKWALETGRSYIFCGEKPKNHWYPGAGMGMSFKPPQQTEARSLWRRLFA